MKIQSSMGLVFGLGVATVVAATSAMTSAQSGRVAVAVSIHVESTKSNGRAWDPGGGAPDIELCVAHPSGSMRCQPGRCQDQFDCRYSDVIWEAGSTIQVRDADVASDDLIGQGICSFGDRCLIGRATVRIGAN